MLENMQIRKGTLDCVRKVLENIVRVCVSHHVVCISRERNCSNMCANVSSVCVCVCVATIFVVHTSSAQK